MIVTAFGESIECARAVRGTDSVRLYGETGEEIASFGGVRDFGGFALTGGTWSAPAPDDAARLAAVESVTDDLVLMMADLIGGA